MDKELHRKWAFWLRCQGLILAGGAFFGLFLSFYYASLFQGPQQTMILFYIIRLPCLSLLVSAAPLFLAQKAMYQFVESEEPWDYAKALRNQRNFWIFFSALLFINIFLFFAVFLNSAYY